MPSYIHAVILKKKKKNPFQNPLQGQRVKIPLLVWVYLLCLCFWSTKEEVYNHTNSFQVFVTRRSFTAEILWISSRKHILNVWPVGICREQAEPQMLNTGEKQDLSLHQTTLSGWQNSNIVVRVFCCSQALSSFCQTTSRSLAHNSESS